MAINKTYEEAYARYTIEYMHTDIEKNEQGELVMVIYIPMAVCDHKTLNKIFAAYNNWPRILEAMRSCVGKPRGQWTRR